ncbi:MAG: helix-turn-helix domain-containing protein [Dehalococcoidia bacterium]
MITSETPLLTIREAANRLSVSAPTIRRWIRSGKLRAQRLAGRTVRIKPADLEAATSAIRVPTSQEAWREGATYQGHGVDQEALLNELNNWHERLLAARGGKPFSDSAALIRKIREERDREL